MPVRCCWGSSILWWLLLGRKRCFWRGSRGIRKCLLSKAPPMSPKAIPSPGQYNFTPTPFSHQLTAANSPNVQPNSGTSSFPNSGKSETTIKVMTLQSTTFTTLYRVLTTQSYKNDSPSYPINPSQISSWNCPKTSRLTKWLIQKR